MAGVTVSENGASGEETERTVYESKLYTVEERLSTFKATQSSWPFDSGPCTPKTLAEAGFYYCGTTKSPDWVRCIVCHENLDGWEENDDPMVEHKRCSPKCAYLKIKDPYNITVGEVTDLEKAAIDYYVTAESSKVEADATEFLDSIRAELVKRIEQKEQEEEM